MSEPTREEGIWWTPEDPSAVSAGTLVIDEGRIRLESVVGPLSNIDVNDPQMFRGGPPLIHGRTHANVVYSCVRTIYSGHRLNVTPTGRHIVVKLDVIDLIKVNTLRTLTQLNFALPLGDIPICICGCLPLRLLV